MNKYLLWLIFSFLIVSCSDSDPMVPQESELITSLNFYLEPMQGGESVIFSFSDKDGDGGENPIISTGKLKSNTVYNGSLELLNESGSSTINLTNEIAEESQEHQFFFNSSKNDFIIEYADADPDGLPIGLLSIVNSGQAGTGALTITLRHEPDKFAVGVSDGLIENAGGETDIEVTFNVEIE